MCVVSGTAPTVLSFSRVSLLLIGAAGGPDFFVTHLTMSSAVRPPLYSVSLPLTNHLRVGKPAISKRSATALFSVASTLGGIADCGIWRGSV